MRPFSLQRLLAGLSLGILAGCMASPSPVVPTIQGPVGLPHRGVQSGAAKLPQKGEGFRRMRTDGIRWGNPRMVAAIQRAAKAVHDEAGGEPLVVADLAAEHGGNIPRHRSHRSGRDADLLFYAVTPDGRPVLSPGFVHYGPDGLAKSDDVAGGYVRIDVERSWLLVRALMEDEEARVLWLFVARWIEAMLIEHAIARGEDDEIVWRAARVMRQPSDSFSHDDHFHLRVACTPAEVAGGCIDGAPRRPWMDAVGVDAVTAAPLSDAELVAALFQKNDG